MSTLKPEVRQSSVDSLNESCSFVQDHKLCACNSSSQEVLCDMNRWLNLNCVEKGHPLPHDQKHMVETDFTLLSNGEKLSLEENLLMEEYCEPFFETSALCLDNPVKNYCSHAKNDGEIWLQELESIADDSLQRTPLSKYSDLDSHWTELRKLEPWWNSGDKDVASFSSHRSSSHLRYFDHSGLNVVDVKKASHDEIKCSDFVNEKKANASCVADCTLGKLDSDQGPKNSSVADCNMGNFTSMSTDISLGKLGLKGNALQGLNGNFRSSDASRASKMDAPDSLEPTNVDLSKPQLLEALCHSQTRAREAEKLAQEACAEKDHVVELFFKQASHLLAYKQWIKFLQIETLCCQHGSKDNPCILSPIPLPRILGKNSIMRKNKRKVAKKKPGERRCYACKYAVAFLIGLTLTGAGLFVGWTIGWLFPAI